MGATTSRKKYTLTSSHERNVSAEAMGATDEMNMTLTGWKELTTSREQDTLTLSDEINVSAETSGATTSRKKYTLTSCDEINVSAEAMGASEEINVSTDSIGASDEVNVSAEAMGGTTSRKQDIFMPQETQDNSFDITLVVEDGKEFKAHRKVLSEASSFFEKLLNTDMMESKKGVVRLEMLTKAGLGAVLEFIYTGNVQILTEDDARGLIEMADYLFILPLKTLAARVLAQMLDTSNCISTYYLAERYQCKELVSDAKTFIHANFTNAAKTESFLSMSSEEVNQWISSDEINVSTEEDVFKNIVAWIDHDKSERKKYFADLFRQVRLIYVSRDYLLSDVVTNDLVNDNACCLKLVKAAMKAVDSKNSENVSFPPPRKSLETPVIVVAYQKDDEQFMCYVPSTNTWYKLRDTSPRADQMVSCHGTLFNLCVRKNLKKYVHDYKLSNNQSINQLSRYDSFFDRWTDVPYKRRRQLWTIFVSDNNEDGIYALESEIENDCVCLYSSFIMRYKPELNSWENIATFDLGSRIGVCIVAKDNFIYFIGGAIHGTGKILTDVDRYDLRKREWDKLANLREARCRPSGTAAYGKIFISGGWSEANTVNTCEVYNETTNEWQSIATSSMVSKSFSGSIVCVDGKVYVVGDTWRSWEKSGEIECYDPDKDEWNAITKIPVPVLPEVDEGSLVLTMLQVVSCSMRVFKEGNLRWMKVIT